MHPVPGYITEYEAAYTPPPKSAYLMSSPKRGGLLLDLDLRSPQSHSSIAKNKKSMSSKNKDAMKRATERVHASKCDFVDLIKISDGIRHYIY